ncbi:MAG: glycosyltransferase, partial [Selenomonadaceae bacterium]|nr:glycosyltransferase [Selenomonadaceae bacterium]
MARRKTKKFDKIKISACYIVKDAAKDLRRSLESVTDCVDEIIVVDTGSTDETVAVAENFGAKIFHEPWQNDFSTPRNVALREAKGDWILFLDADEFFVNDTAKNLRAAIKLAKKNNVKGLFVKLTNIDADNDDKILSSSHVLRLFENSSGVHYVGKIHEQVFIGDELLTSLMMISADLLTLWHTGYSSSIFVAKMKRNLQQLLEELSTTDNPKRIYGYLAENYHALGDFDNAEKFARLDFDSGATLMSGSTRILLECLSKKPARADELLKYAQLAVERYPDMPEFSAKLAEILSERGDYRGAVDEMTRALEKFSRAEKLFESSTFDEAAAENSRQLIDEWQEKIPLTPEERRQKISAMLDELIQVRELFHDKEKILQLAKKIFALKPDEPEAIEKVASIYVDFQMRDEAKEVLAYMEEKFPPSSYRLMLRARFFFFLDNTIDAMKFAKLALEKNDGDFVTMMLIHNLLGQIYRFIGDTKNSVDHYKRNALIDLTPVKGTPKFEQAEKIRREEYSNILFNMHNLNVTREELFEMAKGFNKLFKDIPRFKHNRKRHARHKKIRVGYISPDVRFHVVAFFSLHLFMDYDKTRFEVFIYANNPADNVTEQFAANVDGFRDILDKSALEVAKQIMADEIDILVDLAGHSAGNSLETLAYKPAPIQISGIGYFDTTGLDTVDYFIADKFTDPEGLNEKFFSEKILRLQHSHFCYVWHDFPHMVSPAPCLKKGYVTFVSFNDIAKVTDEVLQAWSKILDAVPNSRLFLKSRVFYENGGSEFILERMKNFGIDINRVDREPFNPVYVKCYEQADIALDTFPYPGGGTTCDALYMGVPVITLVGDRHNLRFGYSLLMNMGLEELCAFSVDEYIKKAVDLANDYDRLREYHLTIRRKMEESPVMNDTIYMGELEQAYEKIFYAWTDNKPLPDFPQDPEPVTEALAKKYYQRVMDYVKLEEVGGESKYNRIDFKRSVYYGELAAQVESVVDAKLLLVIADRLFLLNDDVGSYEVMRKVMERLYSSNGEAENYNNDFLSECHAKLAKYAQNNGFHVESTEN